LNFFTISPVTRERVAEVRAQRQLEACEKRKGALEAKNKEEEKIK